MGIAAILGIWLLALLPGLSSRPWSTPLSLLGEGHVAWIPMVFAALLTGMLQALTVRWWFARRRWWAGLTQVAVIDLVLCGATPPYSSTHEVAFIAFIVLASLAMVMPWIGLRQRKPVAWFLIALVAISVPMVWQGWGLGGFQRAGVVIVLAALSWHWHVTAVGLPMIVVELAKPERAKRRLRQRPRLQLSPSQADSVSDRCMPLRLVPRMAPIRESQPLLLWTDADASEQRHIR